MHSPSGQESGPEGGPSVPPGQEGDPEDGLSVHPPSRQQGDPEDGSAMLSRLAEDVTAESSQQSVSRTGRGEKYVNTISNCVNVQHSSASNLRQC